MEQSIRKKLANRSQLEVPLTQEVGFTPINYHIKIGIASMFFKEFI